MHQAFRSRPPIWFCIELILLMENWLGSPPPANSLVPFRRRRALIGGGEGELITVLASRCRGRRGAGIAVAVVGVAVGVVALLVLASLGGSEAVKEMEWHRSSIKTT
ncbi:hypothetical protein GCM10009735_86090 [Actinomadura chokoriensis]